MAEKKNGAAKANGAKKGRRGAGHQGARVSHPRPHLRCRRRRRRRRRPARDARLRRSRPQDGVRDEGVPDALAHGRSAGRRRRGARQHGAGRLALAHVRHGEGRRLARRPGRHRIPLPQRARRGVRDGALRRAVLAHRGRQDLPAPVRRHDDGVRRGTRRHSARAPLPTAPATPCCTRCTASRCATRRSSSSSISPSTC